MATLRSGPNDKLRSIVILLPFNRVITPSLFLILIHEKQTAAFHKIKYMFPVEFYNILLNTIVRDFTKTL